MDMELLACPRCGSEIFVFVELEGKIVFHVTTHYLALVISDGGNKAAEHIDVNRFQCGACSWAGGVRELAASHD